MQRANVRRTAVTAVVAVSTMFFAACVPWPSSWLGESGRHVGVIGDSLVRWAEVGGGVDPNDPDRYLSQALVDADYRGSVAAAIGAETKDLAPMAPFPDPGVEILVIGLGTNDMRDSRVPLESAIVNLVGYLDTHPVACTALITIVDGAAWGLDVTAPAYNAELARLATERDDVILADWAAEVHAHPEYIGVDGVHHTEVGQAAYRSLVVSAADDCSTLIAGEPTSTSSTTDTTVDA